MSTLWLIVYFGGKIAEVVGPLQYDMDTCKFMIDRYYENKNLNWKKPNGEILHGVAYSCEEHVTPPTIGSDDIRANKVRHF
jgi:hypothetical protein